MIDPTTQVVQTQFLAFDPTFTGGVRVAVGDVTGDAYPDLVVAPGPGGGPVVKVYDGAAGVVRSTFFAYDSSFRGGVRVAAADLTGDGTAELVTGAGPTGGPQANVFARGSTTPSAMILGLPADQRVGIMVAGSAQPLRIPATPDALIAQAYAQVHAAQQAAIQAATPPPAVYYPYPVGYYPYGYYPYGYGGYGYNSYGYGYYDEYGYYDPGYADPGYYDPGYSDPGSGDFGYDPGIIDV